jgi:hypothetical protein
MLFHVSFAMDADVHVCPYVDEYHTSPFKHALLYCPDADMAMAVPVPVVVVHV